MKPCIFIHTNEKQIVGALVSKYSFERFASGHNAFDVKLIHTKDYRFLDEHEGRSICATASSGNGRTTTCSRSRCCASCRPSSWAIRAARSWSIRMCSALSDVMPLLSRDMDGKAMMARKRGWQQAKDDFASSVMLLDNAKLKHWQVEKNFEEMFQFKRDYMDWITLRLEPAGSIGVLGTDVERLRQARRPRPA